VIKLKELLELRNMKYRKAPIEKHIKRMEMKTPNFVDMILPHRQPYENDSRQTLNELKYLSELETNDFFVKKHDDILKVFVDFLKESEVYTEQREKIVKLLIDQSRKFIMTAKYTYNRPRPNQIAKFYGIELYGTQIDSMKTPSYPSGHAVQGYLVAEILKSQMPHLTTQLNDIAEDIADSRIVGKAHFPSDKEFGKKIAQVIHQGYRKPLSEEINIDVNVGDTIMTGRFKNKKTKVKSIGKDKHGMPTINGRKVVTFRMGKKVNVFNKENINERVDFVYTAQEIVKQQGLKSKVKIGVGPNKADYDWAKDIIYIRPSYSTMKDFLTTIYHEIDHARDRKKYGASAYEKKYQRAGDLAVNRGRDFHDDNAFEEKAEKYGRKMAVMHMKKK
jgi:hypothetical protein